MAIRVAVRHNTHYKFDREVDLVKIFKEALAQPEIIQLMNGKKETIKR